VHNLLVDPATQSSNLGLTRRLGKYTCSIMYTTESHLSTCISVVDLGDQLWDDLSHSIVTHCLSNSIPKHSSEVSRHCHHIKIVVNQAC
jgi:hypothetical protein